MKNSYLLSLFIILMFTSLLPGQSLFPEDSAQWKVFYFNTNGPIIEKQLVPHRIAGDTVLVNKNYQVIRPGLTAQKDAYLRVDTAAQKVYFLRNNKDTNAHRLLYDFSKTVGDTIRIIASPFVNRDTIVWRVFREGHLSINQQPHRYLDVAFVGKHYQQRDSIYMDRWIEGIGSVRGLFAPFLDDGLIGIGVSARFHLVCMEDFTRGIRYRPQLLTDTSFLDSGLSNYYDDTSNCNTPAWNNFSREEIPTQNVLLRAFPNPFRENLTLQNPSGEEWFYKVTNLSGKTLFEGTLPAQVKEHLSFAGLPGGMYLLHYISDTRQEVLKVIYENDK